MPTKQFRDLLANAQGRQFINETVVDKFLDSQGCRDLQTRIAVKHALAARGELATDKGDHRGLATDERDHAPAGSYVDRLLHRAGIRPLRSYTESDVDRLLKAADITDVESRVACKTTLAERGQIR